MANNTIMLTLHYLDENQMVQVAPGQYHSLMSLIADQLAIPGFGLCCGMGSCGTCVVQITSAGSNIKRSVLACGILVNDELANKIVLIPDKIY
ncbi:2Fe-2S iron-sulfur cluster-binding protein [Mucilaginibacter kameinonensis]|uniref:2Fe-2S iron-sulfur cluster-binding protein n=1 Tax=Mucilaginibacter kameinonensis TaxID=452286 RepID=UPI000EF785BB|nr:2Fe-2S iron-sulfur cluster-binding protein [Mucilaginibacter kameinonensis]